MPTLTTEIHADGPLVRIGVLVSRPRSDALAAAGRPIPSPVVVAALVETGASGTCIDPQVIQQLGLVPTGATAIGTPSSGSTGHICNQYDVSIAVVLDDGQYHVVDNVPVIESDLAHFGFHALLGRDILSLGHLFLNGPKRTISLAF